MPKPAYNHLYGRRWKAASKAFLKRNPFCCFHATRGELAMATLVDHKTPHHGDRGLFWDQDNWQGLCKHCHDSVKQRLEKSGRVAGCTVSGIPIDPMHPWNAVELESEPTNQSQAGDGVGRSNHAACAQDTGARLL